MTTGHRHFAVKRTTTGLGLFTLKPIRANKRIIEYTGTVISNEEADIKRGMYLFELDEGHSLDGSAHTNPARYINHCCQPNAEAFIYGHRVWIHSKRVIRAGEAITIDYGKPYFDEHIRPKGCRCAECAA